MAVRVGGDGEAVLGVGVERGEQSAITDESMKVASVRSITVGVAGGAG